jgi:hypothetical protein
MEISNRAKHSTTVVYTHIEEREKKQENKTQIKEIKLKLPKKVTWTEDTIDNENMNKKRSKSKIIFYSYSLLYF